MHRRDADNRRGSARSAPLRALALMIASAQGPAGCARSRGGQDAEAARAEEPAEGRPLTSEALPFGPATAITWTTTTSLFVLSWAGPEGGPKRARIRSRHDTKSRTREGRLIAHEMTIDQEREEGTRRVTGRIESAWKDPTGSTTSSSRTSFVFRVDGASGRRPTKPVRGREPGTPKLRGRT